jgi:H/ACA ribonucleoprotein complex subunit 1
MARDRGNASRQSMSRPAAPRGGSGVNRPSSGGQRGGGGSGGASRGGGGGGRGAGGRGR